MALRGPLPDVDIPAVSLFDHVFGNLTPAVRDKVAIVHAPTGQELTFGQLAASVERVAAWFAAHGVGVGDAVALALPTSPDYVTAFHGIARAGAAASPMNVQYAQREFADQLELVKAKYVVVHAMLLPLVAAAAAQVGMAPEQVIVVGAGGPEAPEAPSAASAGHTAYEDLLTCTAPVPAANVSDPATHVACLPLSSGIGGLMRPVMLTHRNLVANATQISPVMDCFPGEHTLVAFLPLSHVYALTVSVNFVLATRHRLVTLPVFHPEDFLGAIQKYKATMLSIVPSVASLLARHPMVDAFDVSSVKVVISGAAPISEELGDALAARVGCRVLQGYGMTETSPVTHITMPDVPDVSCVTIGQAISGVEFRVVDPVTKVDVAIPASGESEPGEMWVKGPNVMLGYLDRPAETAAMKDADGFLNTGDLVCVDARGVVRIVGRTKELIKSKGFQVAPAELEEVLKAHPAIADAGVFGVSLGDGTGDEVPHAVVSLKPGATANQLELIKHVSSQVAKYKFLRSATIVPVVPRKADGSLDRGALQALSPAGQPRG